LLETISTSSTPAAIWRAQRQFAAKLLEYVYPPDRIFAETAAPPRHRRWLKWRPGEAAKTPEQEDWMNAYRWVQIVTARTSGQLPAWEGIRIVREQVPPAAGGNER